MLVIHRSRHIIRVLLHYLAKHKKETGKILLHLTQCLMSTKLTYMIDRIEYALYGVKLNAQNFILSNEYPHRDVCATSHLRH